MFHILDEAREQWNKALKMGELVNIKAPMNAVVVDLAKRVDCNQTTLGRWLRGETNISSRLEKDLNQMIQDFIKEIEVLKE